MADTTDDAGAPPAPETLEHRVLAILARPISAILDGFDDVGATVLLAGQMFVWLVRPPYR